MTKISIITCVFIGVFLLIVLVLQQRTAKSIQNKKYTIGTIIQREAKKNGFQYQYSYDVQNNTYQGSFWKHRKDFSIGERIFISFNPSKPAHAFLEHQAVVPRLNLIAPKEGWKKIPD